MTIINSIISYMARPMRIQFPGAVYVSSGSSVSSKEEPEETEEAEEAPTCGRGSSSYYFKKT
ncbi:hypothetical protein ACFL1Z_07200 [Thermodesulfobacteriota bacterium]